VAPKSIEEIPFAELSQSLRGFLQPKTRIIAAERTRFHQCRQNRDESISDYVARLRKMAQFCEFDKLKVSNDPTEDMILIALVAGLFDSSTQTSVLEKLANTQMSVNGVLEHVRNIEQMKSFISDCSISNSQSSSAILPKIPSTEEESIHKVESLTRSKPLFFNNCKFCGTAHEIRKCPAYGKQCSRCQRKNHFAKVCSSRKQMVNQIDDSSEIGFVCDHVFSVNNAIHTIVVNKSNIPMQIDTGASVSIISKALWEGMGCPSLTTCKRKLETYDGHIMKVLGSLDTTVEWNDRITSASLIVVESSKPFGLIGRDNINEPLQIFSVTEPPTLPVIKGFRARIELKEGANLKFCRARPVPLSLEEPVAKELNRLQQIGIITPVEGGASCASPVVWVRKPDGTLRMCVDYSTHLNDNVKTDSYPTPCVERLLAKMKNAHKFAKLDLTSAYWQIELDDASRDVSVINTTKGLFYVNRLQMGLKNASAIFQKIMESNLE